MATISNPASHRVGGIELGFKLIHKIHQSPDMFCPLDNMTGKLSDIKPKQKLIYRKCGNVSFRLEADIDITVRGGEYQLGENSLYKEDSALKKRLDVEFLAFNRYVYCRRKRLQC